MEQSEFNRFLLPHYEDGPVGRFYRKIMWNNGFEKWELITIDTEADGNCLFHAIANGFFLPYCKEIVDGNKMTKREIVKQMRKEFSEKLSSPVSSDPNSKSHYDTINSGKTSEFPVSSDLPQYNYSLSNMQKQLNSDNYIGYGYIEYISNILGKNIYILMESSQDLYPFEKGELLNIYKKDRSSLVLYYMESDKFPEGGHYELIGIMNNGIVDTYFSPDHTFIKFLYNKVLEKSK